MSNIDKKNKLKIRIKLKLIFFFSFLFFFKLLIDDQIYNQDNLTLVTALFKIKSKHKFKEYLVWVNNLLQLNRSIVFFIEKSISKIIKKKRPRKYQNKTVWIELDMKNFYSFKHFKKDFEKSYEIDIEKFRHTVQLYMIWAEKCFFVKKAIIRNYFNSKCFYWIDAGYFRNNDIKNFINNWPSINECNKDPRVLMIEIKRISNYELNGFKKLDNNIYNSFIKHVNVGGTMFGGKYNIFLKFIYLYYKTLKLFIKNKMFIGKDQNLFAYIAYMNKNIVKLVPSRDYHFFKSYLSERIKKIY